MGVDMFICGCCQWVFHNIEEFMLHKNTLCGENNQNRKEVIKMETGSEADNNIQEVDSSTGKVNELPVGNHVIKQETSSNQQIIQVQTAGDGDETPAQLGQVIQHHIVQLQSPDGLQQLQIANVPGQNIELQDIITALQQGQALTDQDGTVLPTEIQVVVTAKTDGEPSLEMANMAHTTTVMSGLGESMPVSKPARRRGRPRKGEEKNKPPEKVEHLEDIKPKLLHRDADGNLSCGRCKKKFSKERHFNTHKCLALSDFVDIMESDMINMGEESDSEEEQGKDADFRAPAALKKPRLEGGSVIIIKPQNESEDYYGNSIDKKDGTMKKTEEMEKPVASGDKQGEKAVNDGLVTSMEEISDLTKEGLADFPGAGDVKLSQVRVEDGTDEVKLQDTLTAELNGASQEKECYKPRRGRRQKGTPVEIGVTRQVIKNLPIFKSEEDRIEFEKCANVDLSEVDHLYRQLVINQDINEYAPPLKNRASDKLSVFSCGVCQKIIMTKSHARLHCLTHTNLKPFKCFKCQFATNTKGNLYSHMRKHTGQLYRCSVCQFSTINKGHLIEHEAVHSTQRHECKICHKDYSTVKSLYGHIRRKHGSSKKGKEYMLSISRGHSRGQAILHQCQICNRKFKKKIDRDRHIYMHDIKNNPNVFSCDLCNRTCSRRAYLEKHLMRHRIIYFCCDCDQKFPSTLHLTQHLTEVHFSGENVTEELLNEKFEKCIENSIFLPEPDGSMNFDDEMEDGENAMLDGDGTEQEQKPQVNLTDEENTANGDLIERVEESQRNATDINQEESNNDAMETSSNIIANSVLLAKTEHQSVTELEHTAPTSNKEAPGESLEDTDLMSADKDGTKANLDVDASYVNRNGERISTEESCNPPGSAAGECGSVVNTSSGGIQDDGENTSFDDSAVMETNTVTCEGENESSSSNQEIIYDKQFFRNMGFRALTVNVYNQIRQVFGKEECEFCGRLYFSAADFEHHRRTHTGERPFGCIQCNYRAINKENLKRHVEKEHDKVKFACNKCNFLASNRSQLWSHIQSHKNPDAYTCPACSRTFSQPKTLKIHINITHPDMPEEEVKMATSVQHRARTKIGRKCYRCPHCDRGLFRNGADLQKHIWIHEGIKPFKCPLCPHACRSRNNLASHMIRHSLDKPFLCTECGRAYKSKTALRWHVRSHKDGKFKCPKCPYEATQTSHLKRHMETHEVIKRYVCQHCSYSSNTLGYLKIHYARRHKGQNFTQSNTVTSQVPMVRPMPDADTKVYRCLSCDYLFGNLSDMKRHLKLRHQIQIDSTNILEDLTVSVENNDGMPQVLTVSSMNTVDAEDSGEQEAVVEQVVQMRDQLGVTVGTMPAQDDNTSVQPVQYSVTGAESDDKIQSAVSILQQIIDITQQGALGQQEITVKSQDGQSFIVHQQGEVEGTKHNNNQFVIQYVMADGQEVTISEAETQQVISGSEVMSQEEELSQKVNIQHQDMTKLPVDIHQQDISNLSMEQTVEVLDSRDEHTQPLVLDFDGHGSVNSALPPHMVHISNIAMEMNTNTEMRTSDGITNVLALEVPADTLTNIN